MFKWFSVGYNKTYTEAEAENIFLSSSWLTSSHYVDIDKLKSKIISITNFINTQSNLEYYFNESEYNYLLTYDNLDECTRGKSMFRYGTPCKYIKGIIIQMYIDPKEKEHLIDNYKVRFYSVFKNRDPKNFGEYVPFMSNYKTLEQSLRTHSLNEEGITTLKELCWVLNSVIPNIEYCPILIYVISLLLVFMNKEEIYTILKCIMLNDYKCKDVELLRFKFRFTYEDNKKIVLAFIECFTSVTKYIGKEILNKFDTIGFDIKVLIEDMFFTFFAEYFNFSFITVFLVCFLREGTKMFYRVTYAMFKLLKEQILQIQNKDDVIPVIKEQCFNLKDINAFLDLAFNFKVNRYNNKYKDVVVIDKFENKCSIKFSIPKIEGDSEILSDTEFFFLWNLFPQIYMNNDAKLIYSTDNDDNSLNRIYEICSCCDNSCFNSLMIIQTRDKEKFGVVMSTMFDKKYNEFYTPAYISLVSIWPQMKLFPSVTNGKQCKETLSQFNILLCQDDKIVIGLDENGPAIELDKELKIGVSSATEIFGNDTPLSKQNDFTIDKIEIYTLF
jgi:hypothetical protein